MVIWKGVHLEFQGESIGSEAITVTRKDYRPSLLTTFFEIQ